ncbi:MAG: M48 family metalloprotease [Candidatus Bathyarchaeota archaeon]|nr:M48 family metalloprotease [Candidatus Bathyarchaeota archaeon]
MMEKTEVEYLLDTETTDETLRYLPEYLYRYYLLKHESYRSFTNVRIADDISNRSLLYRVIIPNNNEYVDVQVTAENPIKVKMNISGSGVSKKFLDNLYEDLFLVVQLFEEEARKSTLYFAFAPGEKTVDENSKNGLRIRLFSDSMVSLYVALLGVTFFLFWFFGWYAPIIFVFISFGLALFSGKLLARGADWIITEQQPEILILQYRLSPEEKEAFRKDKKKIHAQIRKELFHATLASDKPLTCETANSVFTKYGINCNQTNFLIRRVNLYNIVRNVAEKFRLAIPKVVVTNSVIPNAAAAGPSAKLGTVIVTTGILTQLEDDELESVIAHEFSHLKARDPLVMSTLSSTEFLLRFYVFWPYLFTFGFFSFWAYLLLALSAVYFFGKFLEGRADLDAAKVIGKPEVMAEALRKIGFRRLFPLYKREPEYRKYRVMEWLQLDPHPPIYFRVERLDNLKEPEKIKSTFWRSIKDNLKGLKNS